jgi:uncharacterized protein YacL
LVTIILRRIAIILAGAILGWAYPPLGQTQLLGALIGACMGGTIAIAEWWLADTSLRRMVGACLGLSFSIGLAFMASAALNTALPISAGRTSAFLQLSAFLLLGYLGLTIGARQGDLLNASLFTTLFGNQDARSSFKLLDTSVIIDGRIADIVETGFLEGSLVIPQFVLRELQLVADSADSLKRNRGRRGLDILQRIQNHPSLEVKIVDDDFPQVRDVDLKLIELAKTYRCKIVTNDFNLNKVAKLQGIDVLNINELANSLKPVVLPGEVMRVFVSKEGKEVNQGVAYLDDGTMVVVDNARRHISKTIEISVTSVLQTTAGKMIFGKFDEKQHAVTG